MADIEISLLLHFTTMEQEKFYFPCVYNHTTDRKTDVGYITYGRIWYIRWSSITLYIQGNLTTTWASVALFAHARLRFFVTNIEPNVEMLQR